MARIRRGDFSSVEVPAAKLSKAGSDKAMPVPWRNWRRFRYDSLFIITHTFTIGGAPVLPFSSGGEDFWEGLDVIGAQHAGWSQYQVFYYCWGVESWAVRVSIYPIFLKLLVALGFQIVILVLVKHYLNRPKR